MALAIILIGLAADRITKMLAEAHLYGKAPVPFVKGIAELTYLRNTGAAFSFLSGRTRLLAVFTLFVAVYLVYFLIKQKKKNPAKKLYLMSIAMIITGALGNMWDRFALGYVIDFINFTFISFPVFNVADIFITIGGVIFCCCLLFDKSVEL